MTVTCFIIPETVIFLDNYINIMAISNHGTEYAV